MQAIKFKNFRKVDFTWNYDGVPYTFKAGQEIFLEDFKAQHFAKHLIDEELNERKILTNDKVRRAELEKLCFPSDEVVTPVEALNINKEAEEEVKPPKEVKAKKKGKAKKVEEEKEFEDLNQ